MNECTGAMDIVKSTTTGSIAVTLGQMVREKQLTREQNDEMMVELMAWDKGGERPEWFDTLLAKESG